MHQYGSSRLGIVNCNVDVQDGLLAMNTEGITTFTRGNKFFELSNHLGNVLVTVSDKKIAVDNNSDGIINHYTADVVNANDYFPFGLQMPGRKYSTNNGYRYGFNGKETDKDINSVVSYDYGFRIYNPAIGKFLSVDPLMGSYPMLTPYQFASNRPIDGIDLDGLEFYKANDCRISTVTWYDPVLKRIDITAYVNLDQISGNFRRALCMHYNTMGEKGDCDHYPAVSVATISPLETPKILDVSEGDAQISADKGSEAQKKIKFKAPQKMLNIVKKVNPAAGSKTVTVDFDKRGAGKLDKAAAWVQIVTWILNWVSDKQIELQIEEMDLQSGKLRPIYDYMQAAIIDNTIPLMYRNPSDLTSISEYLLSGKVPTTTFIGVTKTNQDLLSVAKNIWKRIETDRKKTEEAGYKKLAGDILKPVVPIQKTDFINPRNTLVDPRRPIN